MRIKPEHKIASSICCFILITSSLISVSATNENIIDRNSGISENLQEKMKNFDVSKIGQLLMNMQSRNTVISKTYYFSTPSITTANLDTMTYGLVCIPDTSLLYGTPGEPIVPVKPLKFLLPQGTTVDKITITVGEKQFLPQNNLIIQPGQKPIPNSNDLVQSDPEITAPNQAIYSSDNPFPGKLYNIVSKQYYRGYTILNVNLFPGQYIPRSGEFYWFDEITVTIDLLPEQQMNSLFRGVKQDRQNMVKMVDNPELADSYSFRPLVNDEYDLLLTH